MPTLESAQAAQTFTVIKTRVFPARRARVYDAWTQPEMATKWFGPADMYCTLAEFDLRVGGSYRLEAMPTSEALTNPDLPEARRRGAVVTGRYIDIVPHELLQFTWEPSWNPSEHSTVTVTLRDVDEGTEMTLKHENLRTEASRQGHNKGWDDGLDKMQAMLSK